MIIDCHSHTFVWPLLRHSPESALLLSAEQQIARMDAKGIDKAVLLPLSGIDSQSIGEILFICSRYPGRFIPFCCFDPRMGRRPDQLTARVFDYTFAQCRDLGFRGFGELSTRIPWDDPVMLALLEACRRVEFPVLFHTNSPDFDSYGVLDEIGLPRLEKVLGLFPGLRLIGHSAAFWSEISGGVTPAEKNGYPKGSVKPGGRVPELLRRYPGLYGDLSAGSGFNALTRDPAHAFAFIDEFQDRLFLGLDICSVTQEARQIEWLTEMRDAGHVSGEAWDKIMWRNIDCVLNLGLAGAGESAGATKGGLR